MTWELNDVEIIPTWDWTPDEWQTNRQAQIEFGGSDAGTIMGVNKYKSPFTLFMEKTGQVQPEEAGDAADWGHLLEEPVAHKYAKDQHAAVVKWSVILKSKDFPFTAANVDFWIVEESEQFPAGRVTEWRSVEPPPGIIAIFEGKTTGVVSPGNPGGWEDGNVPASYKYQGLHYMIVSGVHDIDFVCLVGGRGVEIRYMQWDQIEADALILAETLFFAQMTGDLEPDVDSNRSTEATLKALYPRSNPDAVVEGGEELQALVDDYTVAKAQLEAQKDETDGIKNRIIKLLGAAEAGTVGGETVVTYRSSKDGEAFDADSFKKDHPDLFAAYKKPKPGYRTLRLK